MEDNRELVSVIMSTYNETEDELRASISSILNQTYVNIELIIVDDNPENKATKTVLGEMCDQRIHCIVNEKNLGLVESLNKALKRAKGTYIARMDADDISETQRIEKQLSFLRQEKLDLAGAFVQLINENGDCIKECMRFPVSNKRIIRFLRWGCCVLHPTWFGKKEVFDTLSGYRKVPYCEDYDLLIRAVEKGFRLGNVPERLLSYRIRAASVSCSHVTSQYIIRLFLSGRMNQIPTIDELEIYIQSEEFKSACNRYEQYVECKQNIKHMNHVMLSFSKAITNVFFFYDIREKVTLLLREQSR